MKESAAIKPSTFQSAKAVEKTHQRRQKRIVKQLPVSRHIAKTVHKARQRLTGELANSVRQDDDSRQRVICSLVIIPTPSITLPCNGIPAK